MNLILSLLGALWEVIKEPKAPELNAQEIERTWNTQEYYSWNQASSFSNENNGMTIPEWDKHWEEVNANLAEANSW